MQLLSFPHCVKAITGQHWPEFTHMYPAQGDEIVLVLYEEEFLLIFCVTIVRPSALLWYDDVSHGKCISGLEQTQKV